MGVVTCGAQARETGCVRALGVATWIRLCSFLQSIERHCDAISSGCRKYASVSQPCDPPKASKVCIASFTHHGHALPTCACAASAHHAYHDDTLTKSGPPLQHNEPEPLPTCMLLHMLGAITAADQATMQAQARTYALHTTIQNTCTRQHMQGHEYGGVLQTHRHMLRHTPAAHAPSRRHLEIKP